LTYTIKVGNIGHQQPAGQGERDKADDSVSQATNVATWIVMP